MYLIGILVSFPIFVSGQETIDKLEGKKYSYHSKTYKSKELKVIFENSGDPLAIEYFNKYNNKRKIRKAALIIAGSTLLVASLVVSSGGADFSSQGPLPPGGSPPPSGGGGSGGENISGYIIGGVLVAGVATIIVISSKSKSNLNQAIDQFNEGHITSLSVNVTRYGVGLNLTF